MLPLAPNRPMLITPDIAQIGLEELQSIDSRELPPDYQRFNSGFCDWLKEAIDAGRYLIVFLLGKDRFWKPHERFMKDLEKKQREKAH